MSLTKQPNLNNTPVQKSANEQAKTKKLKARLTAAVFLLFIIIICGLFILSGFSINQLVLAITGNYSKGLTDELTADDWNNLDDDFIDASGDTMSGDLNMNSNKITNIPDTPVSAQDAVNQNYVDNAVAGAGGSGGDVFTNWGQQACPSGTEFLYRGYAFNGYYHGHYDGSEAICLQQPGDAGAVPGGDTAGKHGNLLYPLGTGPSSNAIPPGIPERKEIMCAVCFNPGGACYERWHGITCPGSSGFTPVYTGYGMGGYHSHTNASRGHCVDNVNFDGSIDNPNWGDIWYGILVWDNIDVGLYTEESFVKCAMCCKQ